MREQRHLPLRLRAGVGLVGLLLLVGACGTTNSDDEGGGTSTPAGSGGSSEAKSIALLLPESKTTRYETQDRPLFTAKIAQLCPDCEVLYSNADQDAAKQQQQAEAALTNGADVLVLDPVDGTAAAAIVSQAKSQDVPVVSYDRLLLNSEPDIYISYDNAKVGQLQAQALIDKLDEDGASGPIVMINGAPTDNNAKLFKEGAHSVFDTSDYEIAAEYDTPDWSPDKAQTFMEQQITALGKDGFVGVYAANDGTAGGAIAAMEGAGIDPSTRPTTGQDAELAATQRIISGDQYMTVYKAVKPEAEAAAQAAIDLANGRTPEADLTTNNGMIDVPTILFDPVAVTIDNVADTIIADGYQELSAVCSGDFTAACAEAGIN